MSRLREPLTFGLCAALLLESRSPRRCSSGSRLRPAPLGLDCTLPLRLCTRDCDVDATCDGGPFGFLRVCPSPLPVDCRRVEGADALSASAAACNSSAGIGTHFFVFSFFGSCSLAPRSFSLPFPFASFPSDAVTSGHDSLSVTGGTFVAATVLGCPRVAGELVNGGLVVDDPGCDDDDKDEAAGGGAAVEDVARAAANCSLRMLQTLAMGALAGSIGDGSESARVDVVDGVKRCFDDDQGVCPCAASCAAFPTLICLACAKSFSRRTYKSSSYLPYLMKQIFLRERVGKRHYMQYYLIRLVFNRLWL